MYLSVIVPVYNEAKTLANSLKLFNTYLKQQTFNYEIIIVDDASQDNSLAIAKDFQKQHANCYVLTHQKNQGKGESLRTGLLAGQGDYLLFLDADNATSIDHLNKAQPLLTKYDIIIGSRSQRDMPSAKQIIKQNIIKQYLGIAGNKLIKLFTGLQINDTQCGFKILNKKSVKLIIPKTKIKRWALDVEILVIAKKQNLKIGIIPITWYCGPISRVGIKGYLLSFYELLIIKLNILKKKYD